MTVIKQNIRDMAPYAVPQDFPGIKLNQNESAIDLPVELKDEISRILRKVAWNRYPPDYPEALLESISHYAQFPAAGILAGNSSNELIQVIIQACCDSGDQILTVTPTFSVYERAAHVMNIPTVQVPLKEDFSFDVHQIKKKIQESRKLKAVILTSPNNPSGTIIDVPSIQEIAEGFPGLVVIDEAYFEFFRQTAAGLIKKCSNIVVLRTFSKALRGAGIRLGYLLADPRVVSELRKVKLPFSVGTFQQVAGQVILKNYNLLESHIQDLLSERARVMSVFDSIPAVVPVPSQANFILFRCEACAAEEIYRGLFRQGVLLRSYKSPALKNMLRVTIGTEAENTLFLEKLEKVIEEVSS